MHFKRFLNHSILFITYWLNYAAAVSGGTAVKDVNIDTIYDGVAISAADSTAAVDDSEDMPNVMPQISRFVRADYPQELLKQGVYGTVILRLLVNEEGGVDSVFVDSGVHPVLDSSAARAAMKFKFTPALVDSQAVAVWLQYAYRFSFDEVIDSMVPYQNLSGICIEKGTKNRISDAVVTISFPDSVCDSSLFLPWNVYLKKIGTFEGQHIEEGKVVTTTDSGGSFRFYSLPACNIEVTVIAPGYAPFKTRERINKNEALSVKYYIERLSYSEYEVVVYGRATEKETARRRLTLNEVRRIPGFSGDAVKVIQALPGVSRPVMGVGEIVVRGAPTWDSRFLLDGIDLPMLYHFGGIKSVYNSLALESIDFYPGGFGTKYGGAIAGIIELTGREGFRDRIKGQAEISPIDGSFFIEGPVRDSVTFIMSARRSFIGEFIRFFFGLFPEQFPFSIYPFYWDYLLRTDIRTARRGRFYLTLFGCRDSMSLIFPEMRFGSEEISKQTDRFGMNTTFHMGIAGWEWDIAENWKNMLKYSLTRAHVGFSSGIFKVRQEVWINHVREQLSRTISGNIKLNFGTDMQWLNPYIILVLANAFNIAPPDTMDNLHFADIAAYVNVEWKPIDGLLIIPGLRYDYYRELDYRGAVVPEFWHYRSFDNSRGFSGEPSARLITRYEFVKNHTAKLALGTYNQSPKPMGEVTHPQWGDPTMPATKASHYVAGYEWRITDIIGADVQLYFNKQWDIPAPIDRSDISATDKPQPLYRKDGLGRMYGLELMLRHLQNERFFGWLAYTLSRSERFNRKKDVWEVYGYDETHNLQILGSWRLRRNYEAGFRLRYVTGKPTTPVAGVIEYENSSGTSSFRPVYGETNSDRMDPFFQFDIRIDKKYVFNKWILSYFIDLQNLTWFLYKSPEFIIYNYDYTEKAVFSNFPMYAVGLKVEY